MLRREAHPLSQGCQRKQFFRTSLGLIGQFMRAPENLVKLMQRDMWRWAYLVGEPRLLRYSANSELVISLRENAIER